MICSLCNKPITCTEYKTRKRKRYHNECFAELIDKAESQSQQKASGLKNNDKDDLIQYICSLYGISEIPYAIDRQIDNYINQMGYTYSGIQKTLYYFYELEGNKPDSHTSTIGIVPYIYDEAKEFFQSLHKANESNEDFIQEEKTVRIKIKPKDRRLPCVLDETNVGKVQKKLE